MRYLLVLLFIVSVDVAIAQNWTRPITEGGVLTKKSISLGLVPFDVTLVKGQLYGYYIHNGSGGTRYVRLYDNPAPATTVGTTPTKLVFPLPAGASAHLSIDPGIAFNSGIAAACTTGAAENDVGAPGANECIGNFFYK